jgi:hypothetical protein
MFFFQNRNRTLGFLMAAIYTHTHTHTHTHTQREGFEKLARKFCYYYYYYLWGGTEALGICSSP